MRTPFLFHKTHCFANNPDLCVYVLHVVIYSICSLMPIFLRTQPPTAWRIYSEMHSASRRRIDHQKEDTNQFFECVPYSSAHQNAMLTSTGRHFPMWCCFALALATEWTTNVGTHNNNHHRHTSPCIMRFSLLSSAFSVWFCLCTRVMHPRMHSHIHITCHGRHEYLSILFWISTWISLCSHSLFRECTLNFYFIDAIVEMQTICGDGA